MRQYQESDYPVILEAARRTNEVAIAPIARALMNAGITWPPRFATSDEHNARLIDRDILRAWKELGLRP